MAARLSTEERVAIVKMYYESKSTTQVLRDFRKSFASQPPKRDTVLEIVRKFEATGSVADRARSGRPGSTRTSLIGGLVDAAQLSGQQGRPILLLQIFSFGAL